MLIENAPEKLLLHCCCAPCAGGIITQLLDNNVDLTVMFYNPNIHPEQEYLKRKDVLLSFLKKHHVAFIDSDYDPESWHRFTQGLEHQPERGERCYRCFTLRLKYSARYAKNHNFPVFSSTFGISRWKDIDQVNKAGKTAADESGIIYWDYNWRKHGGQDLMNETIASENFYVQSYCGCSPSMKS